jgi:hypothetical protein
LTGKGEAASAGFASGGAVRAAGLVCNGFFVRTGRAEVTAIGTEAGLAGVLVIVLAGVLAVGLAVRPLGVVPLGSATLIAVRLPRINAPAGAPVFFAAVLPAILGVAAGGVCGEAAIFCLAGRFVLISISLIPARLHHPPRQLPPTCVYVTIQRWRRFRFGHITGIYNRGANDQMEGCGLANSGHPAFLSANQV